MYFNNRDYFNSQLSILLNYHGSAFQIIINLTEVKRLTPFISNLNVPFVFMSYDKINNCSQNMAYPHPVVRKELLVIFFNNRCYSL